MAFKDLFSTHAADYARHRPTYPDELYAWLSSLVTQHEVALDVGTGNGQAAVALAKHFDSVIATDPAEAQLAQAAKHPRVEYRRAGADASGLHDASVDLVTAAQAFHWFPFDAFFREVARVTKPGGALVVWTYALAEIAPAIDAVVLELYRDYFGPYWEPERRLVVDGYRSVSFPFEEIETPPFEMRLTWDVDALIGYLGTWSPLRAYIAEHGVSPLETIAPKLRAAWGDTSVQEIRWPLSVRAFRVDGTSG